MRTPPSSNQVFNNADSFALAFDEAWKRHNHLEPNHTLSREEKVELIFEQIAEHPFLVNQAAMARQVAAFRLRLLGL